MILLYYIDEILQSGEEDLNYVLPVLLLSLSSVVFWYKGNAREVFGLEWGPFRWWLYSSLLTNYMTIYAWWRLIEIGDVWKAGVVWGLVSLVVDLSLNCYYFGFNWRGVLALSLCVIAGLIVHV